MSSQGCHRCPTLNSGGAGCAALHPSHEQIPGEAHMIPITPFTPTLLPESDSIIGCARESPATRVVDQAICPPSPDISDVNRGNQNSTRG